jgi:hypothetical protein
MCPQAPLLIKPKGLNLFKVLQAVLTHLAHPADDLALWEVRMILLVDGR